MAILDWRFTGTYLETVLACSHQERPSVQNLVKTITHDFVIRLAEPSSVYFSPCCRVEREGELTRSMRAQLSRPLSSPKASSWRPTSSSD